MGGGEWQTDRILKSGNAPWRLSRIGKRWGNKSSLPDRRAPLRIYRSFRCDRERERRNESQQRVEEAMGWEWDSEERDKIDIPAMDGSVEEVALLVAVTASGRRIPFLMRSSRWALIDIFLSRAVVESVHRENIRNRQLADIKLSCNYSSSRNERMANDAQAAVSAPSLISQTKNLHCETLSSLSDLWRRTRHFHGLNRRDSDANLDLLRSSGARTIPLPPPLTLPPLFQLLIEAGPCCCCGSIRPPPTPCDVPLLCPCRPVHTKTKNNKQEPP